eukprot:s345_g7.t6
MWQPTCKSAAKKSEALKLGARAKSTARPADAALLTPSAAAPTEGDDLKIKAKSKATPRGSVAKAQQGEPAALPKTEVATAETGVKSSSTFGHLIPARGDFRVPWFVVGSDERSSTFGHLIPARGDFRARAQQPDPTALPKTEVATAETGVKSSSTFGHLIPAVLWCVVASDERSSTFGHLIPARGDFRARAQQPDPTALPKTEVATAETGAGSSSSFGRPIPAARGDFKAVAQQRSTTASSSLSTDGLEKALQSSVGRGTKRSAPEDDDFAAMAAAVKGHKSMAPKQLKAPSEMASVSYEERDPYRLAQKIRAWSTKDPSKAVLLPWSQFEHAQMPPNLLHALRAAGFQAPTPIQAQVWPVAASGSDIIGIARTGSGKTLAYLYPAYLWMARRPGSAGSIRSLLLAPTRELATQIHAEAVKFASASNFTSACVYGGVPKKDQLPALRAGAPILVATPGRLNDFLEFRQISLSSVGYLVFDEADRMLDMGFEPQIRDIVKQVPKQRQTLMFSATWPEEGSSHFRLGSSFIGLGNYHPSLAARSLEPRRELAMQWAPHSQVPMAMPHMAGYPQMAARSPSPSRMMPQPAAPATHVYRHVAAAPSPLGMATPQAVPSPLQVVRVPMALSPTQRHFPANVYPNHQVQLSCGNSSPAPPAPVLLRRPSNDGTAPAWKEMQQRLGYSEAPQTASPQVPPPHSASPASPAAPVLLAKPEARAACGVKEGTAKPHAYAGQTCPTPPVPESTPVDLPWTRLASEALGEDGTLRNPSGGCDELKREKKAPGERSISPAPEAKAREARAPEAKAPAPPRRPSREAKAEDLAWAKPSSTPTSSPTSPNVTHARAQRTPGASPTSPASATTATSSPRPEKKQPSAEKKTTVHERKAPEKAASAKGAIATTTDWKDEKPVESSLSAWKKSQQLLFGRTKTDDEDAAQTFCREMFISRRQGRPEDHYRVLGVLGKGSFGVVRKVQCRQTKAMRVMKIVDKQKALSGGYPLKLIMEEIDKLKSLDHPAVLRLFEYYADSRSLYLITDLLPGGDLLEAVEKSYAERKQLPEGWVAVVFRQACEGVAYCHAKGVMHKDLKLENIMLCSIEPPEAVVIDVGLAELFPPSEAESFKSADAAGTLATMAPEVIRGSFNAKCDVWSLGCCLYALLCTRPRRLRDSPETEPSNVEDDGSYYNYFYPFRPPLGESRSELKAYLERQKRGPDLARLRCSAAADDLVKEMLAYEEPSRSQMRQILAHRWLQSRDR